jgi:hypothetical protein
MRSSPLAVPWRVLSLITALSLLAVGTSPRGNMPRELLSATTAGNFTGYGDIPLAFEPNVGQAPANISFVSRLPGQTVLLKGNEVEWLLAERSARPSPNDHLTRYDFSPIRVSFSGRARVPEIVPLDLQTGESNYLRGSDPGRWQTHVPHYSRVLYRGIYAGIDISFYGDGHHLEYDFVVAPGADYRSISLRVSGGKSVTLAKDGSAKIAISSGELRFGAPGVYQVSNGHRVSVKGKFRMQRFNTLAFEIGPYDHALPLIIDPVLNYSTYVAGSQGDLGQSIAVDSAGNAFITGLTFSPDFPTKNPYQPACASCSNSPDVFVTKLNPTGTGLIYSTFLGGSDYDQPSSIALDSAGHAVVAGRTSSNDFPTKNPIQNLSAPGPHGFVTSLSADGSALVFSTYLGGSGSDNVAGVTTDAKGNVYATGLTDSADFPVTPATNVIGTPPGYPQNDVFVAKLTSAGALVSATVIGPLASQSNPFFQVNSAQIAADPEGNAYIAGGASGGFPVTPGVFEPVYKGPPPFCGSCTMGFIAKLNPSGSAFTYATYLGGSGGDQVTGLAIDRAGNAYVTGNTSSIDFPTTPGAFQTMLPTGGSPCCQTFVAKMNPTGTALVYGTYVAGTTSFRGSQATGIAIDSAGEPVVTGFTGSQDFPLKDPLQSIIPPGGTATYVTKLNATGSAVLFSTFFSGSGGTEAAGLALDASGSVYITGTSFDTDLPVTPGAFQTSVVPPPPFTEPSHAFVTKFDLMTPAPAICVDQNSLFFVTPVNGPSFPVPLAVTNCGNAALNVSRVNVSGPFTQTNTCSAPVAPGLSCTISVSFHPVARGFFSGTLEIFDNAPIQPQTIQLQGQGIAPVVRLSTTLLQADDQLVGNRGLGTPIFVFNQGDDALIISSVAVSGAAFTARNECSAPVAPGSSCVIVVFFHPRTVGLSTGTLTIKDNALDSPQTVVLQGNGLAAYPVPTVSSANPSAILQGSAKQTVVITGTGFFQASIVRVNGIDVPTDYNGETSLTAQIPKPFFQDITELSVDVFTPIPGGGLSNRTSLLVYKDIPLAANDLVYEPVSRLLYASISSSAPANANTIVSIDPTTQAVGNPVSIGNNPRKLAISSDGQFLYVGLDGANAVQQFNLKSSTLGSLVLLPADPLFGLPTTAADIRVVPDAPAVYVVSLKRPFVSPPEGGVALIAKGSLQSVLPNSYPQNVSVDNIRFLTSPETFYGSDGFTFFQFQVANKSTLSVVATSSAPPGLGSFESDGKYLYGNGGIVFDPVANQIIGTYQFPIPGEFNPAVLPDSPVRRTYFLTNSSTLLAFDQTTFNLVGSLNLPPNTFDPFHLVRWGRDGFAFLNFNFSTGASDVILFRSHLAIP